MGDDKIFESTRQIDLRAKQLLPKLSDAQRKAMTSGSVLWPRSVIGRVVDCSDATLRSLKKLGLIGSDGPLDGRHHTSLGRAIVGLLEQERENSRYVTAPDFDPAARLAELETDDRLVKYDLADTHSNVVLALIQTALRVEAQTLRRVLGMPHRQYHGRD